MKKLLSLFTIILVGFLTAACGDTPAKPPVVPVGGGQAVESLLDWMKGGTYSYNYTIKSEEGGQTSEAKGSMAVQGKDFAVTSESVVQGRAVKSRIISREGVTYIIDEGQKVIMKSPAGGLKATGGIPTDYSGLKPAGKGVGVVNGQKLPYEEYNVEGTTAKFYLNKGQVYAIESAAGGSKALMLITDAKKSVPAGVFDLPRGYRSVNF